MIENISINDEIILKNEQKFEVYKIIIAKSLDKKIYGLGLNPECPGNFEWYYEDGKPVKYWVNNDTYKAIFEPKTIIDIIKN